jgi:hypothetical protein
MIGWEALAKALSAKRFWPAALVYRVTSFDVDR